MNVTFWMKREKEQFEIQETYFFEQEEFAKLKSDFDKYSQGSDPIKGSSYKCKLDRMRGIEMIVFLKFDEIAFIRASVSQ